LREKFVFQSSAKEAVAWTKAGDVCGVRKKVEKGSITALGFAFGYSTDEHLELYNAIVSLERIKRGVKVSDPDIQFVLRRGRKNSYLFLLNYHNEKKTFTVGSRRCTLAPLSGTIMKRKHGTW
jgi:hypothetical protein